MDALIMKIGLSDDLIDVPLGLLELKHRLMPNRLDLHQLTILLR